MSRGEAAAAPRGAVTSTRLPLSGSAESRTNGRGVSAAAQLVVTRGSIMGRFFLE